MDLPFFKTESRRKLDQVLALDLGARTSKAVHIQRRGGNLVLDDSRWSMLQVPEKEASPELLAERLKALSQTIRGKTKNVVLALGVADGLVRRLEIPRMPMDDFRLVLKHNSRTFLQQDLTGYTFDYLELPAAAARRRAREHRGPPNNALFWREPNNDW